MDRIEEAISSNEETNGFSNLDKRFKKASVITI